MMNFLNTNCATFLNFWTFCFQNWWYFFLQMDELFLNFRKPFFHKFFISIRKLAGFFLAGQKHEKRENLHAAKRPNRSGVQLERSVLLGRDPLGLAWAPVGSWAQMASYRSSPTSGSYLSKLSLVKCWLIACLLQWEHTYTSALMTPIMFDIYLTPSYSRFLYKYLIWFDLISI